MKIIIIVMTMSKHNFIYKFNYNNKDLKEKLKAGFVAPDS